MRSSVAGLMAAAFIVAGSAPAFAKTETVKGQLIDQECYLMEKKVEADASCAVSCVKSGKPVGLLTADGTLYEVTGALAANKNEKLIAHLLHTVELTGDVSEKAGKRTIAADSLKMAK